MVVDDTKYNELVTKANDKIRRLSNVLVSAIKEGDKGKCPYALYGENKKCYDESGSFLEDFDCIKCSNGYYVF